MVKVLVGSSNPVKIEATTAAFSKYYKDLETEIIMVDSKVSNQPINSETFEGAINRAKELKRINEEHNHNADFFVGLEGGIIKVYSKWFSFAAICVMDDKGRKGLGTTTLHEIPPTIVDRLLGGTELGTIIDELSNKKDTKKNGGASGFFTNGRVTRKEFYKQGLLVALIPFIKEELYFKKG